MATYQLNSSLSASLTAQTLSLKNSGAANIVSQAVLPTYLIIKRVSDGAVEVVRAISQDSSTDLTILRAQKGSSVLAFVSGDGVEIYAIPVSIESQFFFLGSPALGTTTFMHAAIALTGAPQTGIAMTNEPDVARQLSATGNAAGIVGTLTWHGADMAGNAQSEDVTLSGTSTVYTTKAFVGPVTADLPIETHVGTDTVALGVGPALGIPIVLPRNTVESAYLNNVIESTNPTVTFGASVGANKITLNSALNGTPVSFYAKTS